MTWYQYQEGELDMRDIEFRITKAEEGAAFAVHVVPKSSQE